ncbi:hypothetical protein N5D28_20655 [Stutzerimonas stutzeri]|uniref:hypothetical protein n=1 Tax=Stutzerimonas stutzeri TaxID=316 RepID=UPI002449B093|nr:hypothetical protein [Stutzerimonas stutzeri]MDH0611294.1 hypothetical protein [Stutzerimonas stutzeri]
MSPLDDLVSATIAYLLEQQAIVPKFLGIREDGVAPSREEIDYAVFYFWGSGTEGRDVLVTNTPILEGFMRGIASRDGILIADQDFKKAMSEVHEYVWGNFMNAMEETQSYSEARETASTDQKEAIVRLTLNYLQRNNLLSPKMIGAYCSVSSLPSEQLIGVVFYSWINTTKNTTTFSANAPLLLEIIDTLCSSSGLVVSASVKESAASAIQTMVSGAFFESLKKLYS